jgi:hypothetical protein
LIKSWLLALPHLIIVSLLAAPILPWWWTDIDLTAGLQPIGGYSMLNLIVVLAGFFLLITKRYPRSVFDLLMGINRWLYRVLVYVAMMRDEYPPFRLDQGQEEPDEVQTVPSAAYVPRRVSYSSAGKDPVCRSARAEHTGQIHRMAGTISDQIASRMSAPCPS